MSSSNQPLSRREFTQAAALGAAALSLGIPARSRAQQPTPPRFQFIAFSKPFRTLSFDETADLVAEVGWDGIECPVRRESAQVRSEAVEEELPKLVDALRKRQRSVAIITTDVRDASDAESLKVLRTAKRLGITRYRLGPWHYTIDKPMLAQLQEIRAKLKDLEALNRELGMQAGFQNHSGASYVGAGVWDLHSVIRELDLRYVGAHFDIGHATLEAGYSWETLARLVQPHLAAVYVKDFYWTKVEAIWQAKWCPLGEGMVQQKFFQTLKASGYSGIICQHHEYPLPSGKALVRQFQKDLETVRNWIA